MINITITIPDEHISRVLEAYSGLANMGITISYHDNERLNGKWDYNFKGKQENESNIVFARRVFGAGIKAMVQLWEYSEDARRYHLEVNALTPPNQNVPDDIIEKNST